jgi:hypothetical protein
MKANLGHVLEGAYSYIRFDWDGNKLEFSFTLFLEKKEPLPHDLQSCFDVLLKSLEAQ